MQTTSTKHKALLVTGGAGYIGSHTVRLLAEAGESVLVLDSLELGHRDALISPHVDLVVGDLGDATLVERIFEGYEVEAVLHFAAYALVGESVEEPLKYYQNNFAAPLVLLDAMRRHGCRQFIFSSTCATYGNPQFVPMDESHPQNPINPYGASKLMLERALWDSESAWGLRSVILRYFNAAGCSEDGKIGEDHTPESHLIPRALMAATGEIERLTVFGNDYPTPDGTCIRDYIHVLDLAEAHAAALRYLRGGGTSTACNLGTGTGASVSQIIQLAAEITGRPIPVEYGPRRPGDPPELVAAPAKAREVLGWEARHRDPREMVEAAWRWLNGPRRGRYAR
ncbi:MAG: UDP-glucose 4-epimerase GalE [Verrucomicrobiales bacterium]|nr:UDP-glucose 4-epimerase GalE [Verrucomicrobiales bacterium]